MHEHKYFIFEVRSSFEPLLLLPDEDNQLYKELEKHALFEKIEVAVSGCSCGDVIRQKVPVKNA